ncbi:hypothetical protein ACFV24_01470 [Nocardia fluminea]|uniref:hypothetical protein n=1 Tax=Nocardia fluminea TaxID=134984 RepID=UPI00366E6192
MLLHGSLGCSSEPGTPGGEARAESPVHTIGHCAVLKGIQMSLVYRALWQDDRADLCSQALADMRLWVGEKFDGEIEVPDSGAADARVNMGGKIRVVDVLVESAAAEDGTLNALRTALAETGADGVRWKTTLRVWQDIAADIGFAWVDLSVVGDGLNLQNLAPAAPRLVRNMLTAARNPRWNTHPVWTTPKAFSGEAGGEQLAELITDFDRTLPVVVFTRDEARYEVYGDLDRYTFDDLVSRAANEVAGVANVAVLDRLGARVFTSAVGDSYGVWDGAFRVYNGNLDPAAPDDGWRHRYVTADRYMGRLPSAARIVSRLLSSVSPTRRPPESFFAAKKLLDDARAGKRDMAEFTEYADAEINRRAAQIVELRQRVSELEVERLGFEDDQTELLDELEAVTARNLQLLQLVEHYGQQLKIASITATPFEGAESVSATPQTAADPSDAVAKARAHLADRLVIPDYALVELDKLDFSVNSVSWGRQAWRGMRALHAYATAVASEEGATSFWFWCKDSQHPLVWPATPKRLSMIESDTVRNHRKMRSQRMLPVANEVDPSGRIFMEAHLKIAEGGGDLAPRIYFYIDTERAKVHIGYFGPHSNMKNTKS